MPHSRLLHHTHTHTHTHTRTHARTHARRTHTHTHTHLCSHHTRKVQELWWKGLPPGVRGEVWKKAIGNELNISPSKAHRERKVCVHACITVTTLYVLQICTRSVLIGARKDWLQRRIKQEVVSHHCVQECVWPLMIRYNLMMARSCDLMAVIM